MPRKTLIHIGYQKTASTWLQTQFFNHPDLRFNTPFTSREIKEKIIHPHAFLFDPTLLQTFLEERVSAIPDNETLLISTESISGSFFSDGSDAFERANRIKTLFPDATILINIREQQAMLRSSYKHYVKVLGTLSIKEWLNASNRNTKAKLAIFNPIRYQYHYLISHYQSLFGRNNVLVLPCEQLWQSPELFAQKIADFAEIDLPITVRENLHYQHRSNKGLSAFTANTKRHINRFFMYDASLNPKPLLPLNIDNDTLKHLAYRLDRRLPKNIKLRSEKKLSNIIEQWTEHTFQESNRITMELTGLKLNDYGYDI